MHHIKLIFKGAVSIIFSIQDTLVPYYLKYQQEDKKKTISVDSHFKIQHHFSLSPLSSVYWDHETLYHTVIWRIPVISWNTCTGL